MTTPTDPAAAVIAACAEIPRVCRIGIAALRAEIERLKAEGAEYLSERQGYFDRVAKLRELLATARASALEDAAKWHDQKAATAECEAAVLHGDNRQQWFGRADAHRYSAAALRALAMKEGE